MNKIIGFLFVFTAFTLVRADGVLPIDVQTVRSEAARQFESYQFKPESTLFSRVSTTPEPTLKYLKEFDKRTDYADYALSETEKGIVKDALEKLPVYIRTVMSERLLGLYFVKNFLGSGMADIVCDKTGKVYTFLVFNPDVLKKNLDEWLSDKENTVFIDNHKDLKISLSLNSQLNAFVGILLHESTHVVDYVKQVTPFVYDALIKNLDYKNPLTSNAFTRGIWQTYDKPVALYDYPLRSSVQFYGFSKGPLIRKTDAVDLYLSFRNKPFASLYGSKSWAEDLSELVMFHHLEAVYNRTFRITISIGKREIFSYEPLKNPLLKKRLKDIEEFFK